MSCACLRKQAVVLVVDFLSCPPLDLLQRVTDEVTGGGF
jgi:hypothetical protein